MRPPFGRGKAFIFPPLQLISRINIADWSFSVFVAIEMF